MRCITCKFTGKYGHRLVPQASGGVEASELKVLLGIPRAEVPSISRLRHCTDQSIGRYPILRHIPVVRSEMAFIRDRHGRPCQQPSLLGIYRRADPCDGLHEELREAASMVRRSDSATHRKRLSLSLIFDYAPLQVGLTAFIVGRDTLTKSEVSISMQTIIAGFLFPTVGLICLAVSSTLAGWPVRLPTTTHFR